MKKQRKQKIVLNILLVTTCAITTFFSRLTLADSTSTLTETINYVTSQGTNGNECVGSYFGYARLTNSTTGAYWLIPPTNSTTATFTNLSNLGDNASCTMFVLRRNDMVSWCSTNAVTFPVTNSAQYQLTMYMKNSPPPPTNGQPLSLQVNWQ